MYFVPWNNKMLQKTSMDGSVILLFLIVQVSPIRDLKFQMRTNITKTSMELFQSPKKYFLRHKYPRTFLFYRFNQSVQSPTRHLESAWRRIFFLGGGLWNNSMEVFVILVRIRIFNARILLAWTITKRTMGSVNLYAYWTQFASNLVPEL